MAGVEKMILLPVEEYTQLLNTTSCNPSSDKTISDKTISVSVTEAAEKPDAGIVEPSEKVLEKEPEKEPKKEPEKEPEIREHPASVTKEIPTRKSRAKKKQVRKRLLKKTPPKLKRNSEKPRLILPKKWESW